MARDHELPDWLDEAAQELFTVVRLAYQQGYRDGRRQGFRDGSSLSEHWWHVWQSSWSGRWHMRRQRFMYAWRQWWHPHRRCPRCRVGPMNPAVDAHCWRCGLCGNVLTAQELVAAST